MKALTGRKFILSSPYPHPLLRNVLWLTVLLFRRYITFNDNRPCLELIEGGGGSVGILNTLDDAWGGMGTTSEKDGKFVAQLHKLFGTLSKNEGKGGGDDGHKHFITPKFGKDLQFLVIHYAGEVRCCFPTISIPMFHAILTSSPFSR